MAHILINSISALRDQKRLKKKNQKFVYKTAR